MGKNELQRHLEKLISHPILRGFIRLLGFRISRSILNQTLIRLLIPKSVVQTLSASVGQYFTRYLTENSREVNLEKAGQFIRHYRLKLSEDIVVLNLNRRNILQVCASDVAIEGMENFYQAINMHRGILAVGSHVGSVILGTIAFVNLINNVAEDQRRSIRICTDPYVTNFFPPSQHQDKYSFILNDLNRFEMINLMNTALKSRQIVTTNLDVLAGGTSTEVFRLFNRANVLLPAVVSSAKMAIMAEAVLLPWTNRRDKYNRFILRFEKPIVPGEQPRELSEELCRLLEKWILENPEQWIYWDRFHKRLMSDEPL